MKRFFFSFLSLFFPWVLFLIDGYFEKALLALFLQGTIIGWIPAVIWARRSCQTLQESSEKKRSKLKNTEGNP